MRIDNLYSTPRRPRLTITEAWLIEEPIYQQFRRAGRLLIERTEGQVLTNQQITDIFAMAEKGMNDAGANRTLIGKGKDVVTDVASAINKAYQGVAQKISQSGPVSGFDSAVDKLTDKIKDAAGGDEGVVMQAVNKYREFAKKHPIMQGAIYAGLIALAGISGAGLGGAALLGGIKAFDKLLQGNKASSALWSGFLTGATAYGVSKAVQAFQGGGAAAPGQPQIADTGEVPGVTTQSGDLASYKVQSGDTLSQIAQQQNVSVQDLMQANPQITDPNKIAAGMKIDIPAPTGNPVYQGGVGLGGPMPTGAEAGNIQFPPDVATGASDAAAGASQTASTAATNTASGAAQNAAQNATQGAVRALSQQESTSLARELAQKMGITGPKISFTSQGSIPVAINGQPVPMELLTPGQQQLINAAQSMRAMNANSAALAARAAAGMQESRQRKKQRLSELQINRLFRKVSSRLVMEGLMEYTGDPRAATSAQPATQATAQPAAAAAAAPAPAAAAKPGLMSRLGSGLKTLGKQFTTKVTPEKLKMNWKIAGSPTDSEAVAFFLVNQGVSPDVVKGIYAQMKITPPTKGKFAPAAPAADTQGDAAAGAEQPAAAAGAAGAAQPAAGATGAAQPAAGAAGAAGAAQPAAGAAGAAGAAQPAAGATAAASKQPQAGQELEMPGTNLKYKFTPQWVDSQGTAAPEAVAKVLNQLASGVGKADIAMSDLTAARRAVGLLASKKNRGKMLEYTDDEYEQAKRDFFARGGEVIQEPYKEPRLKTRLRRMGSRHIGLGKEPRAGQLAGRGANVGGAGKPVVANEDIKWSKKFDPAARLWENLQKTRP